MATYKISEVSSDFKRTQNPNVFQAILRNFDFFYLRLPLTEVAQLKKKVQFKFALSQKMFKKYLKKNFSSTRLRKFGPNLHQAKSGVVSFPGGQKSNPKSKLFEPKYILRDSKQLTELCLPVSIYVHLSPTLPASYQARYVASYLSLHLIIYLLI